MSAHPIGVFDSGVGGLSVLSALKQVLPNETYIYLGDAARLPYGTKSVETVGRYALQAASVLVKRGVKLLVVACNTATSAALPLLQESFYPLPIVGVVTPSAKAASLHAPKRVAVLATEGTIQQHAYQHALAALLPGTKVFEHPCPLFVTMAEEGWVEGALVEQIVETTIRPAVEAFGAEKPDCWILGCTHYPVFEPILRKQLGHDVPIIHSGFATAQAVKEILALEDALSKELSWEASTYLVTDSVERFRRIGPRFIADGQFDNIKLIHLTNDI